MLENCESIWVKNKLDELNYSVAFSVSINKKYKKLDIHIVASNLYRIFADGKMVAYGPARACHGYSNVDVWTLENENIHNLVIEVVSYNANSYYLVKEQPFLMCEIYLDQKIYAVSNCDWDAVELGDRLQNVQRYGFQRPFIEAYSMQKDRTELYLGKCHFSKLQLIKTPHNILMPRAVSYPKFIQHDNIQQIETGKVVINNNAKLWQDRSLNNIKAENLIGYEYENLKNKISDDASKFIYSKADVNKFDSLTYVVYAFERSITGFLNLNINAIEDCEIYILWDEIIWDEENNLDYSNALNISFYRNTTCNVTKYTLKKGLYNILGFEAYTYHYVKVVVVKGEMQINTISVIDYENPDSSKFKATVDFEPLQKIIESAKNTFSQNAVDVLTDCPSRERAGWLSDSYFSGIAESIFTGENKVERNFLLNYALAPQLAQLPQGMIPMCYPGDHFDGNYIPNWAMWYIIELDLYFSRTDDKNIIDLSKEKVFGLLEFFKKYENEDGLLEDLPKWVFVEWSKANDGQFTAGVNYPSNMCYSYMLKAAARLYDIQGLIQKSNKINERIISQSYNGEFFEDNRIRINGKLTLQHHITEVCQYYAFYFNVASKTTFGDLFNNLINNFGANRKPGCYANIEPSNLMYGIMMRFELLMKEELSEQIIKETLYYFEKMAQRTGTLWEHVFAYASCNHSFTSAIIKYILFALIGYNSNEPKLFVKKHLNIDCKIEMPIQNKIYSVEIKDGKRKLTT